MAIVENLRTGSLLLPVLFLAACTEPVEQAAPHDILIDQTLEKVALDRESIALPKVPKTVSTTARLSLVDSALEYPPMVIGLGNAIKNVELHESRSAYLAEIFGLLDIGKIDLYSSDNLTSDTKITWNTIKSGLGVDKITPPPHEWHSDTPAYHALRIIMLAVGKTINSWRKYGGEPSATELNSITAYISSLQGHDWSTDNSLNFTPDGYNLAGERVDIAGLTASLLQLFMIIETTIPDLSQAGPLQNSLDWQTPLGLVRIAGQQNDSHEGTFLLLIDLGGNDIYTDVVPSNEPGSTFIVIDISGDDKVKWDETQGPGSGIIGTGLWLDIKGDDTYEGGNLGLGSGLLGSGLFWDDNGNDIYSAGTLSQGTGQYGTGIFVDRQGNDHYSSSMSAQGYGGSGGVGILIDYGGNDEYDCGGKVPDQAKARIKRHKGKHYLSFCQGYSSGQRPHVSGGIGLMLDKSGNDTFKADIFAQGGAYWFGLGLLIDGAGNDSYNAFEHAQGESLHLGAGFLGDWEGDDQYIGFEHVQGVGIDRAAGILYDDSGNDIFTSSNESQGTGVKSYGVGILIDNKGNDIYTASRSSQGNAEADLNVPEREWPVGILLDMDGIDAFDQPYSEAINDHGRIQNRQGIAIDK